MIRAPRTGTLEGPFRDAENRRFWRGKVRLLDKSRARVEIPEAKRFSETGARDYLGWAQEEEDATHALYNAKIAAEAERVAAPIVVVSTPLDVYTCDAWEKDWSAARVTKGLTSSRDGHSHYVHHLRGILGRLHPRDWTAEHGRAVVRYLDGEVQAGRMQWKTAKNIWATATKMSADACASKIDALRVRDEDPFAKVEGPDAGADRSKQYLYPSEFLRFVSCEEVPRHWRVAVAQAIYLFPRDGEHRLLRHSDVDLDHGVISITRAWDRRAKADKSVNDRKDP